MRNSHTLAASALSLLALASYATGTRVISMDISKQASSPPTKLRSRASFTESIINNSTGGSYMINLSIGTPSQAVSLVLDTGSSDVFVLSNTADQCTSATLQREYGPCVGGTFNTGDSSTYTLISNDFDISYADQSQSTGDYFSDTVTFTGGQSITKQQLGLALKTTVGIGIMGIGYDTNEAAATVYPSIIDQMVSQGLIASKAYSLYLNDLQASTGSILFGGIDTAKYDGDLIALPVQRTSRSDIISSFAVALTSIAVAGSDGNTRQLTDSSFAESFILDSGTTLTYLPDDVTSSIYGLLNAYDDSQNSGEVFVDCAYANDPTTIDYTFGGSGGPTIKVSLNEIVFDVGIPAAEAQYYGLPFTNACVLGLQSSGNSGLNLLGDTFLRSAYVVYDMSNNQIALAQTSFNATGSDVQEISADATGIPNVSGVASSIIAEATGTARPGVGSGSGTRTTSVLTGANGEPTATVFVAASSAASSSHAAAGRTVVPPFEMSTLLVLGLSGFMALVGSGLVLL